jgi:hypothetical protein
MENEMGLHAVVRCTKAFALQQEMRVHWLLPGGEHFQFSDQDWLLLLLSSVSKKTAAQILMLFLHVWHLGNDVIHGDDTGLIVGSTKFLVSYWDLLSLALHGTTPAADAKGKAVVVDTSKKEESKYT